MSSKTAQEGRQDTGGGESAKTAVGQMVRALLVGPTESEGLEFGGLKQWKFVLSHLWRPESTTEVLVEPCSLQSF